jgi:ATP-dependent DNA ligase
VRRGTFDERRSLLEQIATIWRPPLNLSPVTDDRDVAIEWFETYTAVGVEGLVIKGGAQPYPSGGQRVW